MKENPYRKTEVVVLVIAVILVIIGMIIHLVYEEYGLAMFLVIVGFILPYAEKFIRVK